MIQASLTFSQHSFSVAPLPDCRRFVRFAAPSVRNSARCDGLLDAQHNRAPVDARYTNMVHFRFWS